MQYPQDSFNANQANGTPTEGYSVYQNNPSFANTPINSLSGSQRPAKDSQQSLTGKRKSPLASESHNFSDHSATTWHWGSQPQNSKPTLSTEYPHPGQSHNNIQSFAPPADLGQLPRAERPQNEQQLTSDIYRSPIDRPYVGRRRKTGEQSESTAQSNDGLHGGMDDATLNAAVSSRDGVTEKEEFLPRVKAADTLFAELSLPELSLPEGSLPKATPTTGKQVIVLRSQSAEELANAQANAAEHKMPEAQLLTPNFDSYVGSPILDTTRDAYQDQTQWKAYTPKPEEIELPPPAVFKSTPVFSATSPAVEFSPPAPANHSFEPAGKMAALPKPTSAPTQEVEANVFHSPPAPPVTAGDVFGTASLKAKSNLWTSTPVNHFSSAEVPARQPSYRFERYETNADVAANTTAMTVAHTTPVTAAAAPEAAWLSPWWMLVCLIPFAMYLMTHRDSAVDQYYDDCDDVGEQPRLPPEMIEKPGYSKSDAIYGEKDEYFASEQLYVQGPRKTTTDRLPLTTHLKAAGHSGDAIDDFSLTETVSPDSVSKLNFASSDSVQIDTELDGNASPNFR